MHTRLTLSHGVFYLGLLLMLGTGIMSAAVWPGGGYGISALTLAGAGIALGARLWHRRLHRAARQDRTLVDLGGYPIDLLRDPRFTSHPPTA